MTCLASGTHVLPEPKIVFYTRVFRLEIGVPERKPKRYMHPRGLSIPTMKADWNRIL